MQEDLFYKKLGTFLKSLRPDLDADDLEPATELWETGYLDSFALMETLTFLEDELGRTIEIGTDDLPSFATMSSMYTAFAASA